MMVYVVEAGNLQERFDALSPNDEDEYDQTALNAIHAENEANACLIKAAPDMLVELQNALDAFDQAENGADFRFAFRSGTIRALIAKAGGWEPQP